MSSSIALAARHLLIPLGVLYGAVARARVCAYRAGWLPSRALPVPVICVGNLSHGGVGKTPVAVEVCRRLVAMGRRPAVVSRGYRREGGEQRIAIVSDGQSVRLDAREAGDEPRMMAEQLDGVPVVVGARRYDAGRQAIERFGVDAIVLDDGFQHLGLRRDLDLLLFDATRAAWEDRMAPAGRLREPLSAVGRAGAVVLTKHNLAASPGAALGRLRAIAPGKPLVRIAFEPAALRPLAATVPAPPSVEGAPVITVCGIGNPGAFRRLVEEALSARVEKSVALADHYRYTPGDVERMERARREAQADWILTTEKDATRLVETGAALDRWIAVGLRVSLPPEDGATLDGLLRATLEKQ